MSLTDFSVFCGYASIACWLGAQLPQVVKNIRRRSCEGLSLPFLANWLLGDISNLIGCILTNQLPFQKWLATYFVAVDMMLCVQYFYYQHVNPSRPSRLRRFSVADRPAQRYRAISAVASNVAAAAALAAQHDEHNAPPRRLPRWPQSSRDTFESSPSREDIHDVDESAILADSFHSERGHTFGSKWGVEPQRRGNSVGRYPALTGLHGSTIETAADSIARGRTLQRESEHGALSSASVGRTARINKQNSGMVFLGVFALFGLGSIANTKPLSSTYAIIKTGRVLAPRAITIHDSPEEFSTAQLIILSTSIPDIISPSSIHTSINIPDIPAFKPKVTQDHNEHIIGRIFAWTCTTLYLTSRLPQIWKNYVRKSVEGLSMYLFVFAFLGNVFYVASILTSPEVYKQAPISSDFIKESIPYLLGSAGTLVFDMTIVSQSFIYRSKPRRHRSRSRGATGAEEEGGLLSGDVLARPSQEEGGAAHSRTLDASSTNAAV
ncbi:PQ loop repeat-domain-containing protein [Rhodocollybia butyracea]|uniref:PQ loop repeat-domain-containing protein n=1 Tax=Rhodocollybia butyracea TaxID=206335 RepID=A0A9P5UDI6_9AGAR|nr:PQ loop repeat-domain-containing protein [Rhodocollybia butyracea]